MKKNLRIVALLAAFSGMTACTDANFLTETPTASVAPTNFYKNQGDAISALTAAYATFINLQSPLGTADYFGRNMLMLIEYPTEVVTSRLSAGNERSLMGGFNPQFQSNHAYLESTWEAAYFGINRANSVIGRVPAIDMDVTRRDQIVAEAKFLRAVHYRFLAGLFGGVPLKLTETQSIDEAPPARASAADTYTQIEKDLTEAAAVLPASWPASDFGRATKGAALTLLGKVYLQAAATGAGTAADYQKAEAAFRQVLTLGYSLDANYGSLFDGSNERSKEIIWSIQNIRATGAGGYYSQWFAPVTNPVLYTPGPQNQFQAERPFYESYNPSDTRKDQTWLTSFTNAGKTVTWSYTTSNITSSSNYGSTGPVPRKYLDFGAATNGAEAPDVVLLRYADVLLSLAEAIDANSGPTAEALGYVNQVRARSKVPNLVSGLSAAAFKDSVFSDRRFEFVVEGHGIFDSRRNWTWAKARVEANMAQITNLNKSPFTSSVEKFDGRPISDKWKLYPIPVHACELNPSLTQNPGWEDGICKNPGS